MADENRPIDCEASSRATRTEAQAPRIGRLRRSCCSVGRVRSLLRSCHLLARRIGLALLHQVVAVEVHHLVPGPDEVAARTSPWHRRSRTPRRGAQLRMRAEHQVGARSRSSAARRSCGRCLRTRPCSPPTGRHACAHVEQVDEEVVGQLARPSVKQPCFVRHGWRRSRACRRRAPSSRARSAAQVGAVEQRVSGDSTSPSGTSCACRRLRARARRRCRRRSVPGGVGAARGTAPDSCPASLAAFSTAAQPPSTIRSASEIFLPPDCPPLNDFCTRSSCRITLAIACRLVDRPVLLRREADARAVGAAALVGAAEARRRRPRP